MHWGKYIAVGGWCVIFAGCHYFTKPKPTYLKAEIDKIRTDTIFRANAEEVISALKEAIFDIGGEIAEEEADSIVTFPMTMEIEDFGEYAVKEVSGGYDPVTKFELYEPPSVELHCFITQLERGTRLKIKTIFEAYKKEFVYRESPKKQLTKGYQEFRGEEIKCITTGKLENELLAQVKENLGVRRRLQRLEK